MLLFTKVLLVQFRFIGTKTLNHVKIPKYSTIIKSPNQYTWSQIKWYAKNRDGDRNLVTVDVFQNIKNKNKETYLDMVNIYKESSIKRSGHVEFIYGALKYMKEFGVEKDLEVYKSLIDVFPKGKMIPTNIFQAEFMHYPKHQQCAIDLLEQMEENGVMPDWDMEDQLLNVFGNRGYPVRRYWRMMYWMPKFKNASPWLLPETLPRDAFQLAMLAIQRITSVDVNTEITVFKTSDVKDSIEDTWIVSGQSPDQMRLLKDLPDKTPIYVEGRYRIWLRSTSVTYFTLRADIIRKKTGDENMDDVSNIKNPFYSKPSNNLEKVPIIHEQEDGVILSVCSTGTSGRDSVLSWIRSLEKNNPRLGELPIIFTLKAPIGDSLVKTGDDANEGKTTKEDKM